MEHVSEIKSSEEFAAVIEKFNGQLIVVHFWAPWAPQCQQMTDVMVELSKNPQCKSVKFVKIEAEAVPEVSQEYEIAAVPTVVLIKNKAAVDRVNGANAAELAQKVQNQASLLGSVPTTTPVEPREDINVRLKGLISHAPVMLFMKGAPNEPKCGFSKQIIQILKDHNVQFQTFDILKDDEVRQGLKKYSEWPTYPQLYANGELLGGLDIVKELVEAGELLESLPQQESIEDKLKRLIGKEKVMLFMKGAPNQPKCGFSKTTVGILQEIGIKYGHFDILEDDEVRQGLKKFSDWPTYPQLYVNNDFVGGLDIIKELQETGELESTLKGE